MTNRAGSFCDHLSLAICCYLPVRPEGGGPMAQISDFVLSVPALHPALPVEFLHTVNFPADFSGKGKPHIVVTAKIGKSASPRRRREWRCGRARSIGRKSAGNPALAIQA